MADDTSKSGNSSRGFRRTIIPGMATSLAAQG
jgi:hypothetical protein